MAAPLVRAMSPEREPALKALDVLIDTLAVMAAPRLPLTADELPDVRRVAARLVALAAAHDQDLLAQAGMRLCDLVAVFSRDGTASRAARRAVALHVQLMRRLAGADLPPCEAARMLAGLERLGRHFGTTPGPERL